MVLAQKDRLYPEDRVMNVVNKIMRGRGWRREMDFVGGIWSFAKVNCLRMMTMSISNDNNTNIKANWDDLTISQCFIYSCVQICYFVQSLLFPRSSSSSSKCSLLSYRSALTDSRDTDGWTGTTGMSSGCSSLSLCRSPRWTEFININILPRRTAAVWMGDLMSHINAAASCDMW